MKTGNLDRVAVLFTVIMFLIFLSTLSISLDDEDSVHFALGLNEFNVSKYQPHPPGFPVYIAIGMSFNSFLRNEILSLTVISALFGALSVLVFYHLAKEMFEREIAFFASVLMALTPLFWLNSVKAMSDMTGLFFILLSMLFIYRYIKHGNPSYFYIGVLLSGISAGVRIHSLFILIPILIYSSFFHKKGIRIKLRGCLLLIIAILIWFLPLILITGIPEYFSTAGSQLLYRVDRPDISALGTGFTFDYLGQRMFGFPYFFLFGGYGINLAGLGVLSMLLLFFMAALIIISLKRIDHKDKRFLFFASGIVLYLIVVFITLPPFNPRYLLILIPLLSLIFTSTIWSFKKPNLRYALFGVLVLLVLIHSIFLALVIRSEPSPPVQLIDHVNENYGPGDVLILNGFALKYFIYYQTNLTLLSNRAADCGTIENLLSGGRKVLTISGSEECSGLKLSGVAGFKRDPRVHVKRSMINLYEFLPE
jgi:4-amino-4-deoxy-L-arabinose transferase-like glycosyltransferase